MPRPSAFIIAICVVLLACIGGTQAVDDTPKRGITTPETPDFATSSGKLDRQPTARAFE